MNGPGYGVLSVRRHKTAIVPYTWDPAATEMHSNLLHDRCLLRCLLLLLGLQLGLRARSAPLLSLATL